MLRSIRDRLAALLPDDSDRDEGTVWDLVPSRQRGDGRLEGSGITRDEQERAVREVRERGDAIERELR